MIVIAGEVIAPRELNEPDLLWVQRRTQRIIFLAAVDTQRMARIEFLHFRCDRQAAAAANPVGDVEFEIGARFQTHHRRDRKSARLNSSHYCASRMPFSA